MMLFLFLLFVYFIPSISASNTKHFASVFVINLFLGWTLIGWVAALAWAVGSPKNQSTNVQATSNGNIPPLLAEPTKKIIYGIND